MKKLTKEDYVKKVSLVHNNQYTYENLTYINSTTKVIVTCPVHGDWETNPRNHLKGCGCPKCSGVGLSTLNWISRFETKHGKKYDYSKFVFTGVDAKSVIICLEHGEFLQTPHNHRNGQQCPECSLITAWKNNTYYNKTNAEKNKEKWLTIPTNLYVIKMNCEDEEFYKIGITNSKISRRFRPHDTKYSIEVITIIETNRYNAVLLETELHNINKEFKYEPKHKFRGYTECFSQINN